MFAPFFRKEKINDFMKEIKSWNGTPYRHLWGVKGRGTDCSHFICSVLLNLGILKKIEYQYYPKDWHIHTTREHVLEGIVYYVKNYLDNNLCCIEIDSRNHEDFMTADMMSFSFSPTKVTNHCTFWIGDWKETKQRLQMYNSISNKGVCRVTWGTHWKNRNTKILRIMEKI